MAMHQPRSEIFGLLDNVILLCNGAMVFYGPPGSDVAAFIANVSSSSEIGFEPVSPRTRVAVNPADVLLDLVTREESESYQRAIECTDEVRHAAEERLRAALQQHNRPSFQRGRKVDVKPVFFCLLLIQLRSVVQPSYTLGLSLLLFILSVWSRDI